MSIPLADHRLREDFLAEVQRRVRHAATEAARAEAAAFAAEGDQALVAAVEARDLVLGQFGHWNGGREMDLREDEVRSTAQPLECGAEWDDCSITPWPGGVIPYAFSNANGSWSAAEKTAVRGMMDGRTTDVPFIGPSRGLASRFSHSDPTPSADTQLTFREARAELRRGVKRLRPGRTRLDRSRWR